MSMTMVNDTTETTVHEALQTFAQALADTPQFHAFEEAAVAFNQDRAARQAVRLFQEKQRSLQMMQQLGAITQPELDELKQLQQAMLGYPSVSAYVEAQAELVKICQAAAQEIWVGGQAVGAQRADTAGPNDADSFHCGIQA